MRRTLIARKRTSDNCQIDGTGQVAVRVKATIASISLAMRLTAAILLIGALHVHARGVAQKVSITGTNLPLSTVFHAIEDQTGYGVLMEKSTLQAAKPVSISLTNESIDEVLKACFSFQPWKLKYTISGKTITIIKEDRFGIVPGSEAPQVTGIVKNDQGNPLAGATIEIKSLGKRAITNNDGEFVLQNVPNGKYLLEITYVGYAKFSTTVILKDRLLRIEADLRQSSINLDQVQIIAYGTTTQRLNVGNVSTVSSSVIQKQPIDNPLLALEGRVPGMLITQSTGLAGSGVTVRIQGQNSIQSGNDPLYVVDGVPYISQLPLNQAQILGSSGGPIINGVPTGSGSPMAYLNPSDIESISILKDADATAIYGSRAANGAILITTKKGRSGKLSIDLNVQNGWAHVGHYLSLLNLKQYLTMRHEGFANDGTITSSTDYDINGFWDSTRYTDWQKTLFGKTAQYSNVDLAVNGGSSNTQFLLGTTFHRQTTVFPADYNDQKGSVHLGITSVSDDKRFRMQFSASYMVDINKLPPLDLTLLATELAPNAPKLFNPDGSLNWMPDKSGNSSFLVNPLANFNNSYRNKVKNLISSLTTTYQVVHGLELSCNFGYTDLSQKETTLNPLTSLPPENRQYSQRTALYGNNTVNSWTIEPQLKYNWNKGHSSLEALVGSTIQRNNTDAQQLKGTGYSSDNILESFAAATSLKNTNSAASTYKYNAVFTRLRYTFKERYILDLVARRDGSSRFGSANQFHNFGSAAAGWIFSQENFIRRNLSYLSFGKIRGSFGTTGNDQIGDYQYLSLYSANGLSYQGATGLGVNNLSNPHLQWEETRKLQLGIDLGFFDNRILLTGNLYRNRSSNELSPYSLPVLTGFSYVVRNFPATVQNQGLEVTLNTKNISKGNFDWSTNINLTIPQNKLIQFPGLPSSSYAGVYAIGKPIISRPLFRYLGVDPATGIFQFADKDGKPTTSPNYSTDRTLILGTAPKFYGGLENNVRFKNWQLDFLIQYVNQIGPNYYFNLFPFPGYFNYGVSNQPTDVLDRWTKNGDQASIQKFSQSNFAMLTGNRNAYSSDRVYRDASYIRLKNLSLSWEVPKNLKRKAGIKNGKLYILAQNLFTISGYNGLDPETLTSATLPPLRVITFGAQFTL